MIPRVKICGITRMEDAEVAVEAGASALGFMFHEPSPRHLSPAAAAAIIHRLPALVARVGVFVNAAPDTIQRAIDAGLDTLQFHGDESPEFCRQFPLKVIKAFRIRDAASLKALPAYDQETWLLDSYVQGRPGGTGERFNWDLAVEANRGGNRILLAGGLRWENVAEAVRKVRPYGVDVSSGVESSPGRKDPDQVRRFIAAAQAAG